jgi:hypothetical protein
MRQEVVPQDRFSVILWKICSVFILKPSGILIVLLHLLPVETVQPSMGMGQRVQVRVLPPPMLGKKLLLQRKKLLCKLNLA